MYQTTQNSGTSCRKLKVQTIFIGGLLMLVQHSDGEIVHIEFVKGIELSMSLVDANELHKELTWVLDAINPEPAPPVVVLQNSTMPETL